VSSARPLPTLYRNGTVHALDGIRPAAPALLVAQGRVSAVGNETDLRQLAGGPCETVDLRGASVLPGLIDTHPHVLHFGGLTHGLVDLENAVSHADIVERIRERARRTKPGAWIVATPVGEPHYFLRRSWRDLAEGTLPDRLVLDRATSEHPVFIQAWAPVIPNDCVLNSAALNALGITRETPERVANVWIEKDASGAPTGRLHGSVNNYYTNDPFMNGLLRQIPLFEPDAILAGTRAAMQAYNRLGVTTVYEGHAMGMLEVGVYRTLRSQEGLTLRVLCTLEAEPYGLPWTEPLSDRAFLENLELAASLTDLRDDMLRFNGVTLSRGGPCWPGFLRMHEPYRGPYGEATTGFTFVSEEKEQAALEFCAERGLRLNFIGAGYKDHDEFLDRAERVARVHEVRGRHWVLQHSYLLTEEQARRYARLGFDVTTSMSFCWGKGDMLRERIGAHVLADLIPLRRMLDAGMTVGCGTDWGPKNVFEHVELALTHRFCGSGLSNLGPAQAVSRAEAIRMWTRDAARTLLWPGIGSLAPGNHADLVVVDRDPLACDLDRLAGTRVLRTVLGGRIVHDSGEMGAA
jgi:hypothetical protein